MNHLITSKHSLMRPESVLDFAEPGDTLTFTSTPLFVVAAYAAGRICRDKDLTFVLETDEIANLDLSEVKRVAPNIKARVTAQTIGTLTL